MSEAKHTAAPWWTDAKYDEDESGCAIIAARTDCGPLPGNPTRGMVAFATELLPDRAAECEANARLIAAAPDLLAKLVEIRKWMDADICGPWDKKFTDEIDALVAKAEPQS